MNYWGGSVERANCRNKLLRGGDQYTADQPLVSTRGCFNVRFPNSLTWSASHLLHSFFVSVASTSFLCFSLNEKKQNIEMSCFGICKHSEQVKENFLRSLILFMRFSILHGKYHSHSSVECTTHLFKFIQDVYFLRCWLNWSLGDQTEVYKSVLELILSYFSLSKCLSTYLWD